MGILPKGADFIFGTGGAGWEGLDSRPKKKPGVEGKPPK